MTEFDTKIRALIDKFVEDLNDAIKKSAVDAVRRSILGEENRGTAAPGRARRRAGPVRKTAPKTSTAGRRTRRSPAQIADLMNRVLEHLKGNKGGMRAEEITKSLKLKPAQTSDALKRLKQAKKIRSSGDLRATKYFVV